MRITVHRKLIGTLLISILLLCLQFASASAVAADKELTGDHVATDDGDLIIHPVNHATFVMSWKEQTIYVDPVGGAKPFDSFSPSQIILITHMHGDHLNHATDA